MDNNNKWSTDQTLKVVGTCTSVAGGLIAGIGSIWGAIKAANNDSNLLIGGNIKDDKLIK